MKEHKYDPVLVDNLSLIVSRIAYGIVGLAAGASVSVVVQPTGGSRGENDSPAEVQSQAELGRRADRFEDGLSRWHEWFLETQGTCLKAGIEYEELHGRQNRRLGDLESRTYRLENE